MHIMTSTISVKIYITLTLFEKLWPYVGEHIANRPNLGNLYYVLACQHSAFFPHRITTTYLRMSMAFTKGLVAGVLS